MKFLVAIACALLASCASTTLYRDGVPVARFQGDMRGLRYHCGPDGSISFHAEAVDHSTPTRAQGEQFASKAAAVGSAAGAAGIGTLFAR